MFVPRHEDAYSESYYGYGFVFGINPANGKAEYHYGFGMICCRIAFRDVPDAWYLVIKEGDTQDTIQVTHSDYDAYDKGEYWSKDG